MLRRMVGKLVPNAFKKTAIYQAIKTKLPHDAIYSDEYFSHDVEGPAVASAPAMAQSIVDRFHPVKVVDVGCGTGALLAAFRDRGCSVSGLEYAEAGLRRCRARNLDVRKFDLESQVLIAPPRSDVAISFEVAEHLPAEAADNFVDVLCSLAPVVVCSAAKPGQSGTDHVNLQPKSYWIEKFERRGYRFDGAMAEAISSEWQSSNVQDYYYDNIMVFLQGTRSH
jgi:SAM-dependent methyltransferase